MIKYLIIVVLLCSCTKSQEQILGVVKNATAPASYYVSAAGNDANAGTLAAPFKTLAKINSLTLSPNTIIYLKGGDIFTDSLLIKNSGTSIQPIYVTSYGTGKALISVTTGTGISLEDCEYVNINNIKVRGSDSTRASNSASPTNSGFGIRAWSTQTTGSKWQKVNITNCEVYGFKSGIVYGANPAATPATAWRGYDNATINGNNVHHCSFAALFVWSKPTAATFATNQGGGQYPEICLTFNIHSNFYVANNYIHDLYGSINAADNTIGTLHVGTGIRLTGVDNGTVEYNRTDNTGNSGNSTGTPAALEAEVSRNITWQYNETSNCRKTDGNADGAGIDVWDGLTNNMVVQYNYSHDNDGYGIGGGGGTYASDGHIGRFNILVNNNKDGNVGDVQIWGAMTNMKFYNNTIYSNLNGGYMVQIDANTSSSFYTNNIFASTGTRVMFRGATASNMPKIINNYYYSPTGTKLSIGGTTYTSLASLHTAGYEVYNAINYGIESSGTSPFTNAGSAAGFLPATQVKYMTDYDLTSTAPAKAAGVTMSAITAMGIDEGSKDYHLNSFSKSNLNTGAVQIALP